MQVNKRHWLKSFYIFSIWHDSSHETTTGLPSSRATPQLAPMPDSYDLDRGLLLAVQAIQVSIVFIDNEIIY